MNDNVFFLLGLLVIVILIFFFGGDPDLQDVLIKRLSEPAEECELSPEEQVRLLKQFWGMPLHHDQ